MKGLQYHGAEDIRYNTEIPIPQVTKPDDVVLKVAFCGICGSDLHEYEHPIFFANAAKDGDKISGKKLPLVLGHEFSGTVTEVGSNVTDIQPGDHVVVETTGHCDDRRNYFTEKENTRQNEPVCQSCEMGYTNTCSDLNFLGLGVDNGALAEYTKYSQKHVHKVDKSIPLDVCALIEPLSVVWHAVELADFQPGDDALVLGAGPIGLATLLVLQAKGASRVVVSEPAAIRREQAVKLGGVAFDPSAFGATATDELRKLASKGQGFAASFDCSGLPVTYTTSIQAIRAHGTACNVAIWPHKSVAHYVMDLTLFEKKSVGSLGYQSKDFKGVIKALETGKLDIEKVKQLITGKVALKNGVQDGFLELINHKDKHIKILISPEI
ncbi:(R,R)-butanediol dehydrogenase [Cyberlindnera fabianii]|uniref:(R,R)-butanediol dehydrogenase n=1 Tax=Cyberlindnera fabianii TaxID=36022 RepID=A0A1V2LA35_CYBFA|nr:(R,R)-butanediol dehydrogenase [Cyberlindnera fabianii]